MYKRQVDDSEIVKPLKSVIRAATKADLERVKENAEKEKKAFSVCEEKILKHKLDMKLVNVEYTFDGGKILFYFTADGRVDFRELVKDLASVFRTRIELRQIGVRDEAKMLGGFGKKIFIGGKQRCHRLTCLDIIAGLFMQDYARSRVDDIVLALSARAESHAGKTDFFGIHMRYISALTGGNRFAIGCGGEFRRVEDV